MRPGEWPTGRTLALQARLATRDRHHDLWPQRTIGFNLLLFQFARSFELGPRRSSRGQDLVNIQI
jgi:hypothetical protein